MQKLVCDGCGKGEDLSTPESTRKIKPVKFQVVNDPRESMPGSVEKHEADLCPDCIGHLLFTYFRVRHDGRLALPAFLEPTHEERELRIAT